MSTAETIINYFDGQLADLVVCDGAPDGIKLQQILQILNDSSYWTSRYGSIYSSSTHSRCKCNTLSFFNTIKALNITTHILKPGGTFLAKIFRGKDITLMYAQLKIFFPTVTVVKPKSSRNSSLGNFEILQIRLLDQNRLFFAKTIRLLITTNQQ